MLNITVNNMRSPVRRIRGKAEVFDKETSNLIKTFTKDDNLQSFTIDRVGEDSKFYGFGVTQKINVKLRDMTRQISLNAGDYMRLSIDCDNGTTYPFSFGNYYITQSNRDEKTNVLSVTAYNKLYQASFITTSEVDFQECVSYNDYITQIISTLSIQSALYLFGDDEQALYGQAIANLEGSETLRGLLDDIAEATQCIYYMDNENRLVFRRLDKSGSPVFTITKSDYTSLTSGTNKRLQTVCHITDLNDQISASISASGSTQYIKNNVFWVMSENIEQLVQNAIDLYGGITIGQFDCQWRGDYRLEPGDKIGIVNKDNSVNISYVFTDKITYNGAFQMNTKWSFTSEDQGASNDVSIGDALKQTYARIDKANKQIDIVAGDIQKYDSKISQIELTTEDITTKVTKVETDNQGKFDSVYDEINRVEESVNTKVSADSVAIEVSKQLSDGVGSIKTSTGYTFNEEGLSINKSGSEISTTITEDGMIIYRNSQKMLTANNQGVDALNLHATTYLIVGKNSRFEDFGSRTGCFWIGQGV